MEDNSEFIKDSEGRDLAMPLYQKDAEPGKKLKHDSEFALLERQFAAFGAINLSAGTKIHSINDVAWLFRNLENESVENVFALYQFKDYSYFVQHLSIGSIDASIVDMKSMLSAASKLSPEKIYLVHNHPSGSLNPSKADFNILSKMRNVFSGTDIVIPPGIIINLRSGKFVIFDAEGSVVRDRPGEQMQEQRDVRIYSFNKQILAHNFQPYKIRGFKDVAAFLTTQKYGLSDKSEAIVVNNNNEILAKVILPQMGQVDKALSAVSAYGGKGLIVYGTMHSDNLVAEYQNKCASADITLLDMIQYESGNGKELIRSKMHREVYEIAAKSEHLFIFNDGQGLDYAPQMQKNEFLLSVVHEGETPYNVENYLKFDTEIMMDLMHNGSKDAISLTEDMLDGKLTENEKTRLSKSLDAVFLNASKHMHHSKNLYENYGLRIVGGTIKALAMSAAKNPFDLLLYKDQGTVDVLKLYIENNNLYEKLAAPELKHLVSVWESENERQTMISAGLTPEERLKELERFRALYVKKLTEEQFYINPNSIKIMQTENENQLRDKIKYLGFGTDDKVLNEVKKNFEHGAERFDVKTTSDLATKGNTVDFTLNFKRDNDKVYFNSFNAELKTEKGETRSHTFSASKLPAFTAKEAINLLEGRSVKTNFVNKDTQEKEPVFVKLNFKEPKHESGNYKFDYFNKNYGVDTSAILDKSNIILTKPDYRDNLIKSLEKGNAVKVLVDLDDKKMEARAVLNPQYKNITLYDSDMNRIKTNNEIRDMSEQQEKAPIPEHSRSRTH